MSFLNSIFGKPEEQPQESRSIEERMDFLDTLRLPAIALLATEETALSYIGGLPTLPDDLLWPEWKGKPLSFLCQINLGEIPDGCERHGLPVSGMLYFFYDQEQSTWGFDPKDEGGWRVLYAKTLPANAAACAAPDGLENEGLYAKKFVRFTPIRTYPDWQDARINRLNFSQSQFDQYDELCSKIFGNAPAHHLFGYPCPIQGNDMDLECQLASHRIYCGDASGYEHPRAKELKEGRHEWMLLLQLDTDDDAGMMWGDSGMLYFWVKKKDLEEGRFDKCWMILQCY